MLLQARLGKTNSMIYIYNSDNTIIIAKDGVIICEMYVNPLSEKAVHDLRSNDCGVQFLFLEINRHAISLECILNTIM